MTKLLKIGALFEARRQQASSILSCAEQSYEMALLLPAIEYAKSTESGSDPCYVVFWLHDGFSMWCSPESRSEHVRNIEAAIKKRSVELLGFEIGVDVKSPESMSELSERPSGLLMVA